MKRSYAVQEHDNRRCLEKLKSLIHFDLVSIVDKSHAEAYIFLKFLIKKILKSYFLVDLK